MFGWQVHPLPLHGSCSRSAHHSPAQHWESFEQPPPDAVQVLGAVSSRCTHEERSKIMNTSAFSCAEKPPSRMQVWGKVMLLLRMAEVATWKSLKTTRPHWTPASPSGSGGGFSGMLKVRCWSDGMPLLFGFGALSHSVAGKPPSPFQTSS